MSKATASRRKGKPKKPRPDFPLYPHATGRWCKKVRGKNEYFGKVEEDPDGKRALDEWIFHKDNLLAGRGRRVVAEGVTLRDLCNRFISAKDLLLEAGELSPRTREDYFSTCERLIAAFGKERPVVDLQPADFEALRGSLAKVWGPVALGNEINRVRVVFKYAYDSGLIDRPVRYGQGFNRPSRKTLRLARHAKGPKLLEAAQLRKVLDSAEQPLKAMILLGLNCGFGNADVGVLPISALDFKTKWISFPRPKTGIARRCPLWPETITALKDAIAERPAPKEKANAGLVFITKYGLSWSKESRDNPVAKEFVKLLKEHKYHRPGLGFYVLRHAFETVGGEAGDQVAVNSLMGHADASMAAAYREGVSDERLRRVTDHVRRWLWPTKRAKK